METKPPLDADLVLQTLRLHAPELRDLGVRHVALFGSVARGDADADSDIDLLLDIDPASPLSLLGVVRIRERLIDLLGRSVDVAEAAALKPPLREHVLSEAVHAF